MFMRERERDSERDIEREEEKGCFGARRAFGELISRRRGCEIILHIVS
jgi:hypothetical protein